MYIGRFVVLGRTEAGNWYLGYRVSSRSFPNRRIVARDDRALVLPTEDAPPTDNPYVSYNCFRQHGQTFVVGNGSHVDPVIDKVAAGFPLRDALALSLLALDYEHDDYDTPRVAAGVDLAAGTGYLGIVAADKLLVAAQALEPGEARLIATYERTDPTPIDLPGGSAEALCRAIQESAYEHPVASLVAFLEATRSDVAVCGV